MPTRGPLNPYSVGSPISGESGFYGRHDLVETVVTTLTTTEQNAITLYGQRRIGKSSLLHSLRRDEILQQYYLPVFFDLQLYKGLPPARTLAHLAQTIIDEHDLSLSPPDEADLSGDYRQFQRVFLSKLYSHLAQKRLLLFFDEFDVAVPLNAPPAETLFDYLEPLIEAEKQSLAFIFVVGERLTSLSEGYRHLFKGVRTQPVGRLGQQDTYNLLTGLGKRGNIRYSDEALAEIWALTNGHPYLTQLIGSEVFDHLQKQQAQEAKGADVLACLDKAMEHGQGGLGWFWIGFKPEEQLILSAVAELTDHEKTASDAEVAETLRRRQLFLNGRTRRQAYKPLTDGDFLLETGSRRYQFTVEFIRRWVVKHYPLKQAQASEAEHYYQQGLQAYEDGDVDRAMENYRQALTHNPYFANAQLALAIALRAHDEIPAAIAEYEKAYQLDPAGTRQGLIELRLDYARDLQEAKDEEGALKQARSVLKMETDHPEARQLLSDIYLRQAEASLQEHNLAQAVSLAQTLLKSLPLTQADNPISQRLRDLWLNYSQQAAQQNPPDWDKAQAALDDLETLGLQDETVKTAYNQLSLARVGALLEQDNLPLALSILTNTLKSPRPISEVKELLLAYSGRQVARRRWSEAENALKTLVELGEEEEGRLALLQLYHDWGDSYQAAEKFDEAIEIYRQGELESDTFAFKEKIVDVYLRRAAQSLNQHKLAAVEASYRYALAVLNTEDIQRQIQDQLETYLNKLWDEQEWLQGIQAGEVLQALNLTGNKTRAWQTRFHLKQTQVELEQGFQEAAFQRLGTLGAGARPEIKGILKNYLQRQAQNGAWETGTDILKRLAGLLANDPEIICWQAHWLFLWARALSEDKADRNLAQAGALCQQSLALTFEGMPNLDFLAKAETGAEPGAADLRSQVCLLWIKILLAQAQACLKQNELTEAKALFEKALNLPVQPTDLVVTIGSVLETFSQWQVYQENWTQARHILQIGLKLEIPQRPFKGLLTELTINQANLLFKHDEPNLAFSALNHLKSHSEEEERQRIKTMVYHLSRLYAGRDRWLEARQALLDLRDWLAPAEGEVAGWLDDLNWERLEFIKAKRQLTFPQAVSPAEIERLQEEVQLAKEGYQDARKIQSKSLGRWTEAFIEASLALGQAYLGHHNLAAALEAYQQLLNLENLKAVYRAQVGQSLYVYDQAMLDQKNWDEARSALEALKRFNLPAPDGQTRPDPRVDGAIQRVILSKAEALLKEDRVKEAFAQLHELPRPKPEGEIKEMILDYYVEEHCARHEWPQAIIALEQLDQFLADRSEKTRDQEVLEWLIDRLKGWGQHLEKERDLTQAVTIYDKALYYTRQTARPRSLELADQRIQVTLQLAEADLRSDPLLLDPPPVIAQALQRYLEILNLPECQPEHRSQIKKALRAHTFRLAEAGQWSRAHQTLDYLNNPLFPRPTDQQRKLFTDWRRDLVLAEVRQHLAAGQINEAFMRLDGLKGWLEERDIPQSAWLDNESMVKALVNEFCHSWLQSEMWESAVQALERLGQLFPEDIELKGREVEALCQWGQFLRTRNYLAEALARYERALAKAPGQNKVSPAHIEHALRETQLAQAQQYLGKGDLSAAVEVYAHVLQQPGDDYPPRIRQALKSYSDLLTQQSPQAWNTAQQALDSLLDLNLNDEEVFGWRQNLLLQEVAAWLEQDKLEIAFHRLTALENPWPKELIWDMVRSYSQARAEGWELAVEALRRLGELLAEDLTIRQQVYRELTALGRQLQDQRRIRGAQIAYRTALRFE